MEGMVQIIKENSDRLKDQFDQRIDTIQSEFEVLTKSNSEIYSKIMDLEAYNTKVGNALQNFYMEQINRFNTLSECDEDNESEENNEEISECNPRQENIAPNSNLTKELIQFRVNLKSSQNLTVKFILKLWILRRIILK